MPDEEEEYIHGLTNHNWKVYTHDVEEKPETLKSANAVPAVETLVVSDNIDFYAHNYCLVRRTHLSDYLDGF